MFKVCLNKRRQALVPTLQITKPTSQDILATNSCLQSFLLLKPVEEIKPIDYEVWVFLTWWTDPLIIPPQGDCWNIILANERQIGIWVAEKIFENILISWKPSLLLYCWSFLIKDFIYLFTFKDRRTEGEREGEKHQCARDLARNPGMWSDWESNQ